MGQGDGIRERWRTCENALELALQVFGGGGFVVGFFDGFVFFFFDGFVDDFVFIYFFDDVAPRAPILARRHLKGQRGDAPAAGEDQMRTQEVRQATRVRGALWRGQCWVRWSGCHHGSCRRRVPRGWMRKRRGRAPAAGGRDQVRLAGLVFAGEAGMGAHHLSPGLRALGGRPSSSRQQAQNLICEARNTHCENVYGRNSGQ